MAKYIMALDAGTTSNRCILFNEKGEMCSVAQKEFTQYFPKPGWVEHDALEIWETQLSVARDAIAKLGISAREIAAIGIIVAVLNQLLIRSGREDQAMMTTLAGLVVVLSILVKQISTLFVTIKALFSL